MNPTETPPAEPPSSDATMTEHSSPAGKLDLPSPSQFPDREVVIFDGNCRFCRKQVERLRSWDRNKRLAFVSLHDPWVAEHCPDLSHELLMEEMFVIDRHGRRHGGAAAFRYLTRRLPPLYPLAPLLHIPGSLSFWRWAYRQVAKRRYRLAGKLSSSNKTDGSEETGEDCPDGSCHVHFK